jgi:Ala-tRNA(Pro) deacylase
MSYEPFTADYHKRDCGVAQPEGRSKTTMTDGFLAGVERTWQRAGGHPEGSEASMARHPRCLDRLQRYLRNERVAYELQHHPKAFTARGVAASEHVPARDVAKAVIVMVDGQAVMVVLPSSHDLQLNELAQRLGAGEVRLAEESEFAPLFPDCETGTMPPFGNLYGLPVFADSSFDRDGSLIFQAGTHTDTLRIAYSEFLRLVKPTGVHVGRYRYIPRMPV